jgi:hypothetical protein
MVAAVAENVQDVNKVWDTIKATIIKPGVSVIQSVGEQLVSDFANSQVPGLGDLISMFGPNRKRGNDKAKDSGAHGRNEAGAACPIRRSKNSFTGDTTVLMADGSRKLIRDLRVGDVVLSTNPLTGKTEGKKLTDVRRYLTDSTVHQLQVTSEKGTGKISVTDEHPFWVPDLGRWLGAEDLKPGYRFLTADNKPATVTGTRSFSGIRLVYNLTVDGLHTYYVGAGGPGKAAAADVLVHNDDPNATGCGSEEDSVEGDPDETITVYRGTDRYAENESFRRSGYLMSDVEIEAHWDTRSGRKSARVQAAAHQKNVEHFGSEGAYVEAHGHNQDAPAGRTLISFTTSRRVAEYFSRGGSVYSAQVRRGDLMPQTIEDAGEFELLSSVRVRAKKLR